MQKSQNTTVIEFYYVKRTCLKKKKKKRTENSMLIKRIVSIIVISILAEIIVIIICSIIELPDSEGRLVCITFVVQFKLTFITAVSVYTVFWYCYDSLLRSPNTTTLKA